MTTRVRTLALCALLGSLWLLVAQAEDLQESFDLTVPMPPTPVVVEGQMHLYYEVHLSNFARRALDPVRMDILDATTGRSVATFESDVLERRLDRSGLQWNAKAGAPIEPGRRAVVFVELALPPGTPVPTSLAHRVHYQAATEAGVARVEGAPVPVTRTMATVLGSPLRGGPWVAIHDAAWERGHRRVAYAIEGRARTPGRFAVDWVKLDAQGRASAGARGLAVDTYSHGEAVLAVADATVVHVRDGLPERRRLDERADHALDTASGNTLVLDLGDGRFAHYGHLRPGSVRVVPGQPVRKGEKIAEVGFSGSASDPQLHFNLADGASALGSEGVPFALEHFRSLGRYTRIDQVGRAPWAPREGGQAHRQGEWPAGNSVVQFDD